MRRSQKPEVKTPTETVTRRTLTAHVTVETEDSAGEILSELISTLEYDRRSRVLYATATELGNVVADYRGDEIMTVKFFPNDKDAALGKIGDAELHFSGGPLDGLKLMGFALWERRNGSRNVTFPSRQYSVLGERRSFALLRPSAGPSSQDRLRDLILEAYKEYELQVTRENESMQEASN